MEAGRPSSKVFSGIVVRQLMSYTQIKVRWAKGCVLVLFQNQCQILRWKMIFWLLCGQWIHSMLEKKQGGKIEGNYNGPGEGGRRLDGWYQ